MSSDSSVDVDADSPLQERHWAISRVSWLIMLALLLVATLGLTGSGGVLSRQQATAGAAELDIPRVSRWAAADNLSVRVPQDTTGDIEITVPNEFAEMFAVESIAPQPSSVSATPNGHRYQFESSPGPGDRRIVFSIRASRPSLPSHIGRFAVNGEATGELPIVVLP